MLFFEQQKFSAHDLPSLEMAWAGNDFSVVKSIWHVFESASQLQL
jgi:hypothetical protein